MFHLLFSHNVWYQNKASNHIYTSFLVMELGKILLKIRQIMKNNQMVFIYNIEYV
jgi:hypothetical protein